MRLIYAAVAVFIAMLALAACASDPQTTDGGIFGPAPPNENCGPGKVFNKKTHWCNKV